MSKVRNSMDEQMTLTTCSHISTYWKFLMGIQKHWERETLFKYDISGSFTNSCSKNSTSQTEGKESKQGDIWFIHSSRD